MIYQVTVNAAGCLPDSETYPYYTGNEDGCQTLESEMRDHLPEMPAEQYNSKVLAAVETLLREGSVYVPLEGTYALTVEGQTCQYFALCHNPATQTVHGPTGAGEFGDIPTCKRCADRMAAL